MLNEGSTSDIMTVSLTDKILANSAKWSFYGRRHAAKWSKVIFDFIIGWCCQLNGSDDDVNHPN